MAIFSKISSMVSQSVDLQNLYQQSFQNNQSNKVFQKTSFNFGKPTNNARVSSMLLSTGEHPSQASQFAHTATDFLPAQHAQVLNVLKNRQGSNGLQMP
jgi:hypothetical protein